MLSGYVGGAFAFWCLMILSLGICSGLLSGLGFTVLVVGWVGINS